MTEISNEESLVQQAQAGCHDAFRQLVEMHQTFIFSLLMKQTNANRELSRELAQDVFVRAYQRLSQFDSRGSFKGWLAVIALNSLRNVFKSKAYKLSNYSVPLDTAHDAQRVTANDSTSGPQQSYEYNELIILLNKCMQALHPKLHAAFSLVALAGESYQAVALLENTPIGTIRSRLNRARLELKTCLSINGAEL